MKCTVLRAIPVILWASVFVAAAGAAQTGRTLPRPQVATLSRTPPAGPVLPDQPAFSRDPTAGGAANPFAYIVEGVARSAARAAVECDAG